MRVTWPSATVSQKTPCSRPSMPASSASVLATFFVELPDSAAPWTFTVIGAAGATGSVRRARLVLRIQTSFGGGTSSALSSWAARAAASPRKSCTTPTVIRPPAASTRVIRAACLPSVRSVDPAVVPAGLEVGGVALGEGGEVGAGDDGPAAGDEVGATAGSVLSLQPDPS